MDASGCLRGTITRPVDPDGVGPGRETVALARRSSEHGSQVTEIGICRSRQPGSAAIFRGNALSPYRPPQCACRRADDFANGRRDH